VNLPQYGSTAYHGNIFFFPFLCLFFFYFLEVRGKNAKEGEIFMDARARNIDKKRKEDAKVLLWYKSLTLFDFKMLSSSVSVIRVGCPKVYTCRRRPQAARPAGHP
jgi:hypothetical protein